MPTFKALKARRWTRHRLPPPRLQPRRLLCFDRCSVAVRTCIPSGRSNPRSGRSGYAPACANEWAPRICDKPRVKCRECPNQAFIPVTPEVIARHLRGRGADGRDFTIGVYPMLADETCWFLAIDFDKQTWHRDVAVFLATCRALGVAAALERSRSGNGGHVWIFFTDPVPARVGSTSWSMAAYGVDGTEPGYRVRILRPTVSQPGHASGGRIRESHRAALAAPATAGGQQRIPRRRLPATCRPVEVLVVGQTHAPPPRSPT